MKTIKDFFTAFLNDNKSINKMLEEDVEPNHPLIRQPQQLKEIIAKFRLSIGMSPSKQKSSSNNV